MECPFCKEDLDFDLFGLKYHFISYCEVYPLTEEELNELDKKRDELKGGKDGLES